MGPGSPDLYGISIRGRGHHGSVNHPQSHQRGVPGVLGAAAGVVNASCYDVGVADRLNLGKRSIQPLRDRKLTAGRTIAWYIPSMNVSPCCDGVCDLF